jgi:hypothetical protein
MTEDFSQIDEWSLIGLLVAVVVVMVITIPRLLDKFFLDADD